MPDMLKYSMKSSLFSTLTDFCCFFSWVNIVPHHCLTSTPCYHGCTHFFCILLVLSNIEFPSQCLSNPGIYIPLAQPPFIHNIMAIRSNLFISPCALIHLTCSASLWDKVPFFWTIMPFFHTLFSFTDILFLLSTLSFPDTHYCRRLTDSAALWLWPFPLNL